MQVVIEAQTVMPQCVVQCAFTGMAEGRMANIMHQRERFGEVFIEAI